MGAGSRVVRSKWAITQPLARQIPVVKVIRVRLKERQRWDRHWEKWWENEIERA